MLKVDLVEAHPESSNSVWRAEPRNLHVLKGGHPPQVVLLGEAPRIEWDGPVKQWSTHIVIPVMYVLKVF